MSSSTEENPEFEALLNYIKRSRGFDFTGYKRSSLVRRVQKRMRSINIESFNEYLDYLEVYPEEFIHLFNTILINVTSFFRDRLNWDYIASEIVPQILARKTPDESIRVWSAGCAAGQEAYTLAIILAQAIGVEQFKQRVKIYATDVDDEALNQARHATYTAREVTDIADEMLQEYFDRIESRYIFRKDLRRSVIFGRHNLVTDAPISRIDLLTCRNTLMYFNSETQAKIIARFHFALNDNSFLLLGKAETLLSHNKAFASVDLKRRIFSKVPQMNIRDRLLMMGNHNDHEDINYLTRYVRLREAAFDNSSVAQIVVDLNSILILANERARTLFSLTGRDVGRPLQDLEMSYRPVELRSCIEQVYAERRSVNLKGVEWASSVGSDSQFFDVQIASLWDINGSNTVLGVSINFTDVTRYKRLQQELEHSNQELEMAYEELQSTNEELETTNEELQSSNEELETANEELHSTNEELETMNEELQSSNEELQTLNEELRRRTDELNSVNTFLGSIFTSMRGGVIVVDRDLQVLIWNTKSEELWGMRAEEVQKQHFLNLDIGLPVEQLLQPIRACLASKDFYYTEVVLEAVNRRGRKIQCQVTCTTLFNSRLEIGGVILLMEQQDGES